MVVHLLVKVSVIQQKKGYSAMQKNSFFACLAEKSCEARQKGASIRQELLITTVLQ